MLYSDEYVDVVSVGEELYNSVKDIEGLSLNRKPKVNANRNKVVVFEEDICDCKIWLNGGSWEGGREWNMFRNGGGMDAEI